jgi:hypothetical protein
LRQRKVARLADEKEHGKFSSRIKTAIDVTKAKAKRFADEAAWIFGKRTVRVLAAVVLFVVVVALLAVFLNWYVAPSKPSEKKDLVLGMAQILAGTALLSGLYFTWRTLQVNREGQITERFTRAIDQLGKTDENGNKLLEIRLGGIYALERIARESEEDHWPIMEVLTAYVRQHAPWRSDEEQYGEGTEVAPDLDIQAILTVLQRRTGAFGHGEPEGLDLQKTNLRGANLQGANLRGANLYEADLEGALLSEVHLEGATLTQAYLRNANLFQAHLEEAHLAEGRS